MTTSLSLMRTNLSHQTQISSAEFLVKLTHKKLRVPRSISRQSKTLRITMDRLTRSLDVCLILREAILILSLLVGLTLENQLLWKLMICLMKTNLLCRRGCPPRC